MPHEDCFTGDVAMKKEQVYMIASSLALLSLAGAPLLLSLFSFLPNLALKIFLTCR